MISLNISRSTGNVEAMIRSIEHDMERAIRQGWFRAGDVIIEEINTETLRRPRSGRTYVRRIRGGNRRRHRASAPGETPANRTGNYRRGRGYQVRGYQQLEVGIRNVRYARFLEDGTRNMDARPGVENAVVSRQNQVQAIMNNSIRQLYIT